MEDYKWIKVEDELPACNVLVEVKLTNGTYAYDFVNEPLDKSVPFRHYLVAEWRMLSRETLRKIIQTLVNNPIW